MSYLVCGSLAIDTILHFDGEFQEYLLPQHLDGINICFNAKSMRKEFGGCGGNIVYSLSLLQERPILMAALGCDGKSYQEHLQRLGIDLRYLLTVADTFTSQAIIFSDRHNNQITSFYPGAGEYARTNKILSAEGVDICIVSPSDKQAMLSHAQACAKLKIPLIFDPGQMLATFSVEELQALLQISDYLTLNDYEAALLEKMLGMPISAIAALETSSLAMIWVTHAQKGVSLWIKGEKHDFPAITPQRVVDATGCGDAFRSGLLFGIKNKLDCWTTSRLATLLGGIKVESQGGQNHHFSFPELKLRFKHHFGYELTVV